MKQMEERSVWGLWLELLVAAIAIAGALALCGAAAAQEDDPVVTSWMINLNGQTASSDDPDVHMAVSDIVADVHRVRYNASNVYIDTPSVPSHKVGPFLDGNPAVPSDAGLIYRIPRSRTTESATHPETGLGAIGVFVNGVVFYNMLDAFSYEDEGVWNNNAIIVRGDGMDEAAGHPSPLNGGGMGGPPMGGVPKAMQPFLHQHRSGGFAHTHGAAKETGVAGLYHYHQQSPALREQLGDDGSGHSPLMGFAFDGVPVYGPYGFANGNGAGGVRRMESSWRLREITERTTLPNGNALSANLHGPPIGAEYPLGYFAEDFEYVPSLGDLDEYNGRFAVTPEFPEGVYTYYTTIDEEGNSAYPYIVGPQYYGDALSDNLMGTVTVPGDAQDYVPSESPAPPAEFIVSERSPSLLEAGESFALTAPEGSAYQWRRDGEALLEDSPRLTGVNERRLEFNPLLEGDSGVYTVRYDNGLGKALVESAPITIAVLPVGSLSVGDGVRIMLSVLALLWAGFLVVRQSVPLE